MGRSLWIANHRVILSNYNDLYIWWEFSSQHKRTDLTLLHLWDANLKLTDSYLLFYNSKHYYPTSKTALFFSKRWWSCPRPASFTPPWCDSGPREGRRLHCLPSRCYSASRGAIAWLWGLSVSELAATFQSQWAVGICSIGYDVKLIWSSALTCAGYHLKEVVECPVPQHGGEVSA